MLNQAFSDSRLQSPNPSQFNLIAYPYSGLVSPIDGDAARRILKEKGVPPTGKIGDDPFKLNRNRTRCLLPAELSDLHNLYQWKRSLVGR